MTLTGQQFRLRLEKLNGQLYRPYQFLQVAGYRLAGQACHYRWGKYGVKPAGPLTRRQQLVVGCFPAAMFGLILGFQAGLHAGLYALYHARVPWVPLIFGVLPALALGPYFHFVIFDVLRVWRLLKPGSYFRG